MGWNVYREKIRSLLFETREQAKMMQSEETVLGKYINVRVPEQSGQETLSASLLEGKILFFHIKLEEIKEATEKAYGTRDLHERLELFRECATKAGEWYSQCIKEFGYTDSANEMLNVLCGCLLQLEWLYANMEDVEKRHYYRIMVRQCFARIKKPDALAYFARAHSLFLDLTIDEAQDVDWQLMLQNYKSALSKLEEEKVDLAGIYPNSCYNIGLMYKYGWGVRKNHEVAFDYFSKAQKVGFDCQEQIKTLFGFEM